MNPIDTTCIGPSVNIKALLDEAKELSKLRSEIGRLPSSELKVFLLYAIEEWFSRKRVNVFDNYSATAAIPKSKGIDPLLDTEGLGHSTPSGTVMPGSLDETSEDDIPF